MLKITQLFLLLCIVSVFSQQNITLKGIVYTKGKPLNQVHIYNINSSKGTLSNDKGVFNIEVSLNDVLVINVMPYKEKRIKISSGIFENRKIKINLFENILELETVKISSHGLTGSLLLDAKKVPENLNPKYNFKMNFNDFSLSSYSSTGTGIDRGSSEVRGMNNYVGGGNIFGLVGLLVDVIIPKKITRKKPNNFTKETISIVRDELGDSFFIKELKIPKPHIDDFLEEYCNTKSFIDLYEKNRKIEYIEYLIKMNKLNKYAMQ